MDILFIFKEHPIYMRTVKSLTSIKIGIIYKQQYTPILELQVKSKKGYLGYICWSFQLDFKSPGPSVYICLWLKHCIDCFFSVNMFGFQNMCYMYMMQIDFLLCSAKRELSQKFHRRDVNVIQSTEEAAVGLVCPEPPESWIVKTLSLGAAIYDDRRFISHAVAFSSKFLWKSFYGEKL